MSTDVPTGTWEGASAEHWRTAWGVPRLLLFQETPSTNDVIRRAGLEGAPAGTTAIADFQSRGRGRLGRPWLAPPGTALLMSVLLRPAPGDRPEAAGALPLRAGLAVAAALARAAGLDARLKWPNDVLVGGAKLAGVLCERVGEFVVAGVGVNVGQQSSDFPVEIRGSATSVLSQAGSECGRAELAGAVLAELRPLFLAPHGPLSAEELARYARLDALAGNRIIIDDAEAGVAVGVTPLGSLLVEGPDGVRPWHAGTVRTLP